MSNSYDKQESEKKDADPQALPEWTQEELDNVVGYFEILIEIDQEEKERKRRLIDEPRGFSMPSKGRNCSLCEHVVFSEDGWYDKWGFKCMNCQKAIDKKLIPGSLCGDYDHKKYITDSAIYFEKGLRIQTVRKLERQGKLRARIIPNGPYLFLLKDNPKLNEVIEDEIILKQQSPNH